ncbi:MAG: hypothetical protein FWG35_06295 [Spirochaetaceae bacterium]|nr:hypothetical protein [Spirochaetaceae bacterium]
MKKAEIRPLTEKERLQRICKAFPLLSENHQDYILGIMQALVFAHSAEQKGKKGRAGRTSPSR